MKSTSSLFFISMIIFIACSATNIHLIKHDQLFYDMLNGNLMDEKGKMVLLNGDIISGEAFNIGLDSTFWIEKQESHSIEVIPGGSRIKVPPGEPLTRTIATAEIDYFTVINRGKGSLAGAGTGFWVGAAAGAVWGLTLMGEMAPNSEEYGAAALIFTVPLGGLAGAIIGLPLGSIAGGTDKYILTKIPKDSAATGIESKELIRNK